MDALDTGSRGLELLSGGDFFGSGAVIYAVNRGLVAGCCRGLYSPRRGEWRDVAGLAVRIGLRAFAVGFGIAAPLFTAVNCADCLSSAEFVRVDGLELPESEAVLKRRELMGMRDCESRRCERLFTGVVGIAGLEDSSGEDGASYDDGSGMGIAVEGPGGRGSKPAKSLRVLRCIFGGRLGIIFSILISSSVGVKPRYHADGEDGDTRRG